MSKKSEDQVKNGCCPEMAKEVPGEPMTMKTIMLDKDASIMQSFAPLKGICNHLLGAHFYSGDMSRQVPAHHYCSHISEDIQQCIIYDTDKVGARIIGIEYVVSEKIFKTLPEEEKKLWHSHIYEVKSGALVADGLPEIPERELMEKLITTYGKTFHTWQTDRGDELPYGVPQLMMSFTADGQLNPELQKIRDQTCAHTMDEKKKAREDIPIPDKDPMADHWMKSGKAILLDQKVVNMKGM